ncbi:MAG: class I SAM-dependent methyltransferase, partial [Nostoc sp. C3-bin3]|nr:class I SAM-dependent methyltransferase [Nostoc sp. C3-bin3]
VFTENIPLWEKYLSHFANTPKIQALEIGSYEGNSACWLLDNVLTHESARLTCIDTFSDWYNNIFDFNIARSGASGKVKKIKGVSQEVLRLLPINSYNLVYIDGSHLASDVLEDAVLSWRLVKTGGIIIFDDYDLVYLRVFSCGYKDGVMNGYSYKSSLNANVGIDAFLKIFEDKIKILHKDHQVIVEKISDAT